MSTDSASAILSTGAAVDHYGPDPYGIVPSGFVDRFDDAETIAGALEAAKRAPSSSDLGARRRCPCCTGTKIRQRMDDIAPQPTAKDGAFRCDGCGSAFDTPLPPRNETE